MTVGNVKCFFWTIALCLIKICAYAWGGDTKNDCVRQVSNAFVKEVKKEFGFSCTSSGGSMPDKIHCISVGFQVDRRATIEEARELLVVLTERFLKKINEYEKIRPYLYEYPAPASVADISISFQNIHADRYTDGTVVLIFQSQNTVCYRRADRYTQKLKYLKEEPYEEALKIVRAGPPEGGWPAYTGDGTEFEGPDSWIEQLAYLFGEDMTREFKLCKPHTHMFLKDKLKNVHFAFNLEEAPSFIEAGELTAILTKRLLERINAHEKLHAYLPEYPLDPKRISCVMAMPDFDRRQAAKQFMHIVENDGVIVCERGVYRGDEDNCLHRETFAEAAAREEKDDARVTLLKFKR